MCIFMGSLIQFKNNDILRRFCDIISRKFDIKSLFFAFIITIEDNISIIQEHQKTLFENWNFCLFLLCQQPTLCHLLLLDFLSLILKCPHLDNVSFLRFEHFLRQVFIYLKTFLCFRILFRQLSLCNLFRQTLFHQSSNSKLF